MAITELDLGKYQLGWSDVEDYVFKPRKGLSEEIVREMSAMKGEASWMLDFRLSSLRRFEKKPMVRWFAEKMPDLDFDDIYYYIKPTDAQVNDWDKLPESVKNTWDKLGIPQAERKYLAGVTAQYESEVVYHRNREDLGRLGVLFTDMDTAVREHPEIVRKWFGKIIPPGDNKFAALNSAVWSGGSFIYVPPGVTVDMPLQAYFRINAENMGQFERTLIIADEGAQVHYVEGCSAPVYSSDSLHSAVVELVALPGSRITYTTIQNWSTNLDTGAKMFHCAPETSSTIVSKSISKDGGHATYRGKVHVDEGARRAKSFVRCDALILDEDSISETKPSMEVCERDAEIGHEATVSKIGDDQLFYLMSRGLSETQAMGMIVNGFIEPITRTLPMEYAVEWSRLIELQMDGSVG